MLVREIVFNHDLNSRHKHTSCTSFFFCKQHANKRQNDVFQPLILQSDNGKELVSSVIIELTRLWTTIIQIINGRPRRPASQGLVEQANGILEL